MGGGRGATINHGGRVESCGSKGDMQGARSGESQAMEGRGGAASGGVGAPWAVGRRRGGAPRWCHQWGRARGGRGRWRGGQRRWYCRR